MFLFLFLFTCLFFVAISRMCFKDGQLMLLISLLPDCDSSKQSEYPKLTSTREKINLQPTSTIGNNVSRAPRGIWRRGCIKVICLYNGCKNSCAKDRRHTNNYSIKKMVFRMNVCIVFPKLHNNTFLLWKRKIFITQLTCFKE